MGISQALIAELQHEAKTTRRVLERVPDEHMSWRPHEKSMTLGELAIHIARLPRAIADLATPLVSDVPSFPRPQAKSSQELVTTLDEAVPYAVEKLQGWSDEDLFAMWRMTRDGQTLLEIPRIAVIRNIMFNHAYHHRGQLTVYLRLLDIPLPSVYGPSADEQPFG